MSKKDFYEILGASKTASQADLKAAYRKLAMQYHPDKHKGDKEAEAKFKEINEAYDVLKDEQKRSAYDQFGHRAFEGGGGGAGPGAAGFDFSGSFADIFDDLFGGVGGGGRGRRGGGAPRGADLRYNLDVTLEEAFKGKQQQISMITAAGCETCKGSGAKAGTSPTHCATCNGTGRIRAQQGFFTIERTCASCQGQGKMIKDPCGTCAGSGRVKKEKKLSVSIPAGVDDGTRIRFSGEGEAGPRGGQAGDLYVFISVREHPIFKRNGADLHAEVPIRMTTATLGGNVEVPTVGGGRVKVTIPEGTQSGHQFRLKGKGMPLVKQSFHGDMYIHIKVETPVKLNKKQKDILKEFETATPHNTSPETENFFSKVKDLWDGLNR